MGEAYLRLQRKRPLGGPIPRFAFKYSWKVTSVNVGKKAIEPFDGTDEEYTGIEYPNGHC